MRILIAILIIGALAWAVYEFDVVLLFFWWLFS